MPLPTFSSKGATHAFNETLDDSLVMSSPNIRLHGRKAKKRKFRRTQSDKNRDSIDTSPPKLRHLPKRLVQFQQPLDPSPPTEKPNSTRTQTPLINGSTDFSTNHHASISDFKLGLEPSLPLRRLRPRTSSTKHLIDSSLPSTPPSSTKHDSSFSSSNNNNNHALGPSIVGQPRGRLRKLARRLHTNGEVNGSLASDNTPTNLETRNLTLRINREPQTDEPEVHETTGGGDEDDEEEEGHHEEDANADVRRYPVRNRRHTAMYQVEYAQSHHGPVRNWLAGTGYESGGRRRQHRSRHHRDLEHCGSSTSSSRDYSSDSSAAEPAVISSPAFRPSTSHHHTSWRPSEAAATTAAAGNTSGVDMDEVRFARRCTKSILHARSELMPLNLRRPNPDVQNTLNNRLLSGTTLADIEPMSVDESVGFEQVGGHDRHIDSLKECIILPLMYPEVFTQFGIDPPRGVLFSGPPGTGKTLLARALANECSRMTTATGTENVLKRPIAFFMRKGADCLSKWVGESERQLRLLFDQAYRMRPSIIFFDEIDGLAPVRSSKQDQIHSSIVSTLLSLMDGLDHRVEVVVIGATNRPDAIDPALRRPGRFDREFTFTLPCESVRRKILQVHTTKWHPGPDPELLDQLAHVTGNFSGADLKSLATEACLCCLRRQYPQVYQSRVKLALDKKYLVVNRVDWLQSLQLIRPSLDRSDADASLASLSPAVSALASTKRTPLQPPSWSNLLQPTTERIVQLLTTALSMNSTVTNQELPSSTTVRLVGCFSSSPQLLITGDVPDCMMEAIWHRLEAVQVFTLSLTNLVAFPTSVGMCPEAAIAQILSAVKRATHATAFTLDDGTGTTNVSGVVLYLPRVDRLFHRLPHTVATYLVDRIEELSRLTALSQLTTVSGASRRGSDYEWYDAVSHQPRRLLIVSTLHRDYREPPLAPEIRHTPTQATRPRLHETIGLRPEKLCNGTSPLSVTTNSVVRGTNTAAPRSPLIPNSTRTSRSRLSSSRDATFESPNQIDTSRPPPTGSSSDSESSPSDDEAAACAPPPPLHSAMHSPSHRPYRPHRRLVARLLNAGGLTWMTNQPVACPELQVLPPSEAARAALFVPLFAQDCTMKSVGLNDQADDQRECMTRAPSPPPAAENDQDPSTLQPQSNVSQLNRVPLTADELAQLEREDAQLFRRLRQVLRRVVAHLARHRRFAVFTRPVQTDEAPDYYKVIQHPMDLGSVRDRIDARQYGNVEEFMRDIELIYRNALEYNPANVPRSRDIRSRASEFWDEACLQIEEELHPQDLNERCKAAVEGQATRAAAKSGTKSSQDTATASGRSGQTSAKSRSSAQLSELNALSSETKSLPMPLGGRYSRRLHGEVPILNQDDVTQLQRKSLSQRRSMDNESADSRLLLIDEVSLAMDSTMERETDQQQQHSNLSETKEASVDGKSERSTPTAATITLSPIAQYHSPINSTPRIVTSEANLSSSTVSRHPSSPSFSVTQLGDDGHTAPATPLLRPSISRMDQFCQHVVRNTHGWSAERLIHLYRQFTTVILDSQNRKPNESVSKLIVNLEHMFMSLRERSPVV